MQNPPPSARATPLGHTIIGSGRPVMLLHGVGFGAASFAPLAEVLAARARQVVLIDRPGYGSAQMLPVTTLATQADQLIATLEVLGIGQIDLVGVSGGATLGLAVAIAHPRRVGRVVLHEPLVGPHALTLHRQILSAAHRLQAHAGRGGIETFLATLVGPERWESMDTHLRDAAIDNGDDTLRADVNQFCAFAPTVAELRSLHQVDLVTTIGGSREAAARQEATAVLVREAGATSLTLTKAGHLAQLDDPVGLTAALQGPPFPTTVLSSPCSSPSSSPADRRPTSRC